MGYKLLHHFLNKSLGCKVYKLMKQIENMFLQGKLHKFENNLLQKNILLYMEYIYYFLLYSLESTHLVI